jgi:hypothetical protein
MRPQDKAENPQHEIRNKFECPNSHEPQAHLSSFRILIFGFVSDFGFRVSSFGLGIFIFGLLFLGTWCAPACADGGSVRLSERKDGYRITVFSAPSPFRAGPVDISVLVQDAVTGQPLPEARVTVHMTRIGQPTLEYPATQNLATNKLLHAAQFELPTTGRWELEVQVEGSQGSAVLACEVEAAERLPRWHSLWPWIAWPALAIALFCIHELLARRKFGKTGKIRTRDMPPVVRAGYKPRAI